jgi:four helix bundle protein
MFANSLKKPNKGRNMNQIENNRPKSELKVGKSFRTLDLAVEFYELTQKLQIPKHLKDQLDRATASISLNLSEGNAKFSYKDKARIYQIAYGSFRECQTIFKLADVRDKKLLDLTKHLGSSLYRLIEATQKRTES